MKPPVRVIARLDIKSENVVKGIHLEGLRIVGSPVDLAKEYYRQGVDEIVMIDIVASLYRRETFRHVVRAAAADVFIPITVGGGIRTLDDIGETLRSGADKVAMNTAALARPGLLREAAEAFGSQCVVLSIEAKRRVSGRPGWEAWTDNGRERTGVDVLDWATEGARLGAGEILITSVDREGTTRGLDLDLLSSVRGRVNIPVIGSGGVGRVEHVVEAFDKRAADAVACAHVLHWKQLDVARIKRALADRDVPIRPA